MRLLPRPAGAEDVAVAVHYGNSRVEKIESGVFSGPVAPLGRLDLAASADPGPMGRQSNDGCRPSDKSYAGPFLAGQSEPGSRRPHGDRAGDDRGEPARGEK